MKVLLDTNIISAWLKGASEIADKIDRSASVNIPVIVIGELYYGAQYSANVKKNTDSIDKVAASYNILQVDEYTAVQYGIIKAALRRKGKPIPENDIWIAAMAQQHKLTLITRDGHFSEIETLKKKAW